MVGRIVDRRLSGGNKSIPNRNRFMRRIHGRIAAQVKQAINSGQIGTIFDTTKKITIPVGDLSEPNPAYDNDGGVTDIVISGNSQYRVGDMIPKQKSGQGGGGNGAGNGGGEGQEDEFVFTLTKEEFIDYFFNDLELPNLADKDIAVAEKFRARKAGYTSEGSPANLSLLRTMKEAAGRRLALRAGKKRLVKELEEQLAELIASYDETSTDQDAFSALITAKTAELEAAKARVKTVPFIDEIDQRYRNTIMDPLPTTQAVMFCLMDVSGSMSEWHKDIAKRYYMLLFLFLHQRYEKVDIVFVRHHHDAQEVDEQTFFYDRANGGTIVSKGLQLVDDIIKERYDRSRWNVYVAQASDGDNWGDDGDKVLKLMNDSILPAVQYFFYIEISKYGNEGDLWQTYKALTGKNFDAQTVSDPSQIYDVFRKMFGGKAA
jgi:hypothetical protein